LVRTKSFIEEMMVKSIVVRMCSCFLVAALALALGCSFSAHNVPTVKCLPGMPAGLRKPAVYFNVSYLSHWLNVKPFREDEDVAKNQIFRSLVVEALDGSNLFRDFTFSSARAGTVDYTLKMKMVESVSGSIISVCLTMVTWCIIPTTLKCNYLLDAEVCDAQGRTIKSYHLEDSERTWIQTLFLPVIFFRSPVDVREDIQVNMIKTVLKSFVEDLINEHRNPVQSGDTQLNNPRNNPVTNNPAIR